jgi:hypothetical protein
MTFICGFSCQAFSAPLVRVITPLPQPDSALLIPAAYYSPIEQTKEFL